MKYSKNDVEYILNMLNWDEAVARNALSKWSTVEDAINYIFANPKLPAQDDDMNKAIANSIQTLEEEKVGIKGVNDDVEMQQAIANSLETNNYNNFSYEPLAPKDRKREIGVPVGLKNVGNTWYFNSLIQTYFNIPEFVELILKYNPENAEEQKESADPNDKSKKSDFIKNLRYLFTTLIKSNKKYQDASSVLKELRDEFGNTIPIGDQKDIGEFHLNFINCLFESMKPKSIALFPEDKKEEEKKQDSNKDKEDDTAMAVDQKDPSDEEIIQKEALDVALSAELAVINQINSIFSGKYQQIVSYELNGELRESISSSNFNTIYLDWTQKDLYSAWEDNFEDEVENYKPDDVNVVEAKTQAWVAELPKVLIFLIKRVYYDKEKQIYYKDNEPFEFENVIYPDRYLIKNRAESEKLRKQVNILRSKCTKLSEHINKFKNYNGKKVELGSILHWCTNLLKSNMEDFKQEDNDDLELFRPENIIDNPKENEALISQMINLLTIAQEKTKSQIEVMETQLVALQKEIKDYYKSVDRTPYYLNSIMIHDGNHEGGHFYTFIKDFSKGVYRRYNDISVSEVDDERVALESKGGFGTINAYCLVYINEETYKDCWEPNLHNYNLQFRNSKEFDLYNQLVPNDLAEKVFQENDSLLETIYEAECSELAKEICALYDQRIEKIMTFIEKEKDANLEFVSPIAQFFHIAKNQKDFSHIGKWFLLDICFREKTKSEGGINALPDEDLLIKKVKSVLIDSKHKNAPISMRLSDDDTAYYVQKWTEFRDKLENALITSGILSDIIEDNIKNAILGIIKLQNDQGDLAKNQIARDAAKVLTLRLTSAINQAIIAQKSYEHDISPLLQTIACIFKNLITDLSDNHYAQVIINLEKTYEIANPKMNGYREEFMRWIELLRNRNLEEIKLEGDWTPKYHHDIIDKIASNKTANFEIWSDVYSSNNPGIAYNLLLTGFKDSFAPWIKIHRSIFKKSEQPRSGDFILEAEEELGIKLKAFAKS